MEFNPLCTGIYIILCFFMGIPMRRHIFSYLVSCKTMVLQISLQKYKINIPEAVPVTYCSKYQHTYYRMVFI